VLCSSEADFAGTNIIHLKTYKLYKCCLKSPVLYCKYLLKNLAVRMALSWSHLIRFVSNGSVYYGDAVFPAATNPHDVASISQQGKLRARIIYNDPLSAEMVLSDKELPVDRLLSPLTRAQVPIIRCIGLNYMKHSILGLHLRLRHQRRMHKC
jgi:hypothetical protein